MSELKFWVSELTLRGSELLLWVSELTLCVSELIGWVSERILWAFELIRWVSELILCVSELILRVAPIRVHSRPTPLYVGLPGRFRPPGEDNRRGKHQHTDSHTPADRNGSADHGKPNEMEMDVYSEIVVRVHPSLFPRTLANSCK